SEISWSGASRSGGAGWSSVPASVTSNWAGLPSRGVGGEVCSNGDVTFGSEAAGPITAAETTEKSLLLAPTLPGATVASGGAAGAGPAGVEARALTWRLGVSSPETTSRKARPQPGHFGWKRPARTVLSL